MGKHTGTLHAETGKMVKPKDDDVDVILSLHRSTLDRLAAVVQRVGKQTSADTFAVGKSFSEAKGLLPKKAFSAWLKATCTYTVRSAWNYASVHDKLADLAPILEEAAVGPTVLFELAKAEREQIIPLIEEIEAGKQLTVAEVKARLRVPGDEEAPKTRAEVPGLRGLKRLVEERQQHDTKLLVRYLKDVAQFLRLAVQTAESGKRVTIASMKNEIELELRHASEVLRSLMQPMREDEFDARRDMVRMDLEHSPSWQRAISVLKRAEYSSTWPDGKTFQSWLLDELHPAVEYILEGTPWPDKPIKEASATAVPAAAPASLPLPMLVPNMPAPAVEVPNG